jgi:hypothetical protein
VEPVVGYPPAPVVAPVVAAPVVAEPVVLLARLVVALGVEVLDGLGTDVGGLLATALVVLPLPQPQLANGELQAPPLRQPAAEARAAPITPSTIHRESETRMARTSLSKAACRLCAKRMVPACQKQLCRLASLRARPCDFYRHSSAPPAAKSTQSAGFAPLGRLAAPGLAHADSAGLGREIRAAAGCGQGRFAAP